eukprot:sb/3474135/
MTPHSHSDSPSPVKDAEPQPPVQQATPRFENKFGEVFEPFEEPETSSPGQENKQTTPAAGANTSGTAAAPTDDEATSPVFERKATKPSPIKTHTPPKSFKSKMAGRTLKASLMDAFNDAVFGGKKRTPPALNKEGAGNRGS